MMNTIIFVGVQMGKKRRQYTKEFKVEAVCLIVEECGLINCPLISGKIKHCRQPLEKECGNKQCQRN